MKVLITAGNTQTPVDQVRCITNIFTGKTGAQIALEANRRGHQVTLLISHPEVVHTIAADSDSLTGAWNIIAYRTFDDLRERMSEILPDDSLDVLIHAAAVSDFSVAGVYASAPGTENETPPAPHVFPTRLLDVSAGKVKSHHAELWMKLVPTPKLADMVRTTWGFRGAFVKFKLEVGVADAELIAIANKSREQSDADFIIANTLENRHKEAFICNRRGEFERVSRNALSSRLWDLLESSR